MLGPPGNGSTRGERGFERSEGRRVRQGRTPASEGLRVDDPNTRDVACGLRCATIARPRGAHLRCGSHKIPSGVSPRRHGRCIADVRSESAHQWGPPRRKRDESALDSELQCTVRVTTSKSYARVHRGRKPRPEQAIHGRRICANGTTFARASAPYETRERCDSFGWNEVDRDERLASKEVLDLRLHESELVREQGRRRLQGCDEHDGPPLVSSGCLW